MEGWGQKVERQVYHWLKNAIFSFEELFPSASESTFSSHVFLKSRWLEQKSVCHKCVCDNSNLNFSRSKTLSKNCWAWSNSKRNLITQPLSEQHATQNWSMRSDWKWQHSKLWERRLFCDMVNLGLNLLILTREKETIILIKHQVRSETWTFNIRPTKGRRKQSARFGAALSVTFFNLTYFDLNLNLLFSIHSSVYHLCREKFGAI